MTRKLSNLKIVAETFLNFLRTIDFSAKNSKSLCITAKRCTQIQNFKRSFLENYNDSEHAVKTKNAPCFIKFPNINKNGMLFPTGLAF